MIEWVGIIISWGRGGGGGGGRGINWGEIYTRWICCILVGLLQSIYFPMFGSKHSITFEIYNY